ncbi:MAG: transglycosylase SLT domain-containing protein [Azonexus sp.]|nr:transglycosylase SLT domain-containing protein [Betaproteobacteria bacterium]MBK8917770.1 transglycosylase SLT domain-containing protein [Betaproteobacteria bacterium]MBP6035857.1 transglycosylase SLT domain-containing protein [Azonexus sp.]MBP6906325.1 transglycosylase SLT domain-containing protein [Azonexus sp.]
MPLRNVLSRSFAQVLGPAALLVLTAFSGPLHAQLPGTFAEPSPETTSGAGFSLLAFFAPREISPALPPEALVTHEVAAPLGVSAPIDLTAPTDDLWVRVRNGFAMPNLNDEVVLHHQQWYMNRPDMLRRMVERSRRYMHHIVEELERRGMPTELALLPMVESSFNPMAYSRARASGLWQFIPATGKRYNLAQDWWQDQRRDILASTAAALDYLQTIYEMNGDWHLALASYNWGENAVKRAVDKNLARGLPTDFSSLSMPAETRNYVPKLQALKNIFGNPRLMAELGLPALENQPYFATVDPGKPIDIKTAARLAGMPVNEFLALNPAHNRPVITPDSQVVIPADKLETFQANLESHAAPLSRWQAYTVKPGERLEKLAPRFGISAAELREANGLGGRTRPAAGSMLLVPAGRDGVDIDALSPQARLPRIEADEAPSRVSKGKKGEDRREARAQLARSGKAPAVRTLAKAPSRNKTSTARVAAAKPKATARAAAKAPPRSSQVARAGNGRRG